MTVLFKVTWLVELANSKHATPGAWFTTGGTEGDFEANGAAYAHAANAAMTSPGLLDAFSPDVTFRRSEVQSFTVLDLGGVTVDHPYGRRNLAVSTSFQEDVNLVGTHGGESSAPQLSAVLSLRTTLAGRRHRGRAYMPPPPEDEVLPNGDLPNNATFADVITDWWDTTVAAIDVINSGSPAVVHSLAGTFVNPANRGVAVDTLVAARHVNPQVCTIRHRKSND